MNQKMRSIVMTFFMCIIMCGTTVFNANAALSGNGIGTSKDNVTVGESLEVRLTVPGISQKVASVQFEITFDKNAFEIVSYQPLQIAGASQSSSSVDSSNAAGKVIFTATSQSGENDLDFSAGYTLSFMVEVKQSAGVGQAYPFTVNKYTISSISGEDGYTSISQEPAGVNKGVSVRIIHSLKMFPAVAATCTTSGNNAYYICTACNSVFADAEGMVQTTPEAQTIQPKHSIAKIGAVAPTCTTAGNKEYYTCTVCNAIFADEAGSMAISEADTKASVVAHEMTKYNAVHATHEKNGNIEYWTCNMCNQYFKDAEGTKTIAAGETVIVAIGHTYGSYQNDARNHWKECSCGSVIEKAAHDLQWKVDKEATEEATGLKHKECTVCGYKEKEEVVDKISHTHKMVKTEAKAATCTQDGNIAYYTCDSCKKVFTDEAGMIETTLVGTIVKPTGHILTGYVAVNATHEKNGNIVHWICNVCHRYFKDANAINEINASETIVWATGHTYGSYQMDGESHWKSCSCGSESGRGTHTFQWKVDKTATEDETGIQHEECTVCGYKRNENTVIQKLEHAHKMVKTEGKAATCTQDGSIAYYTCTDCNKIYQDAEGNIEITMETIVTKATGHENYDFQYDEEYHWYQCSALGCGAIIEGTKELHVDENENLVCDWCGAVLAEETTEAEEETTTEADSEEEVTTEGESQEESSAEEYTEENSTLVDITIDNKSQTLPSWGWILIALLACGIVVSVIYFMNRRH